MSRLILLLSPGAAVMSGCWLGGLAEMAVLQLFYAPSRQNNEIDSPKATTENIVPGPSAAGNKKAKTTQKSKYERKEKNQTKEDFAEYERRFLTAKNYISNSPNLRWARIVAALAIVYQCKDPLQEEWKEFVEYSIQQARGFSSPRLMWKTQDGRIIDDYREGYWFLRDKTPTDSRVMAWWDYGYQITGIGERTSLADGNTWNHEHIATIGFMLSSELEKSHRLVKHVADYVLLWCGSGHNNKDLSISHHFARIGNSVYPGHCGSSDCSGPKNGWAAYDKDWNSVSPKVEKSLVWNLCKRPQEHEDFFKLAYETKYGLMRIFEVQNVSMKSREWLADPANRDCDAPGSWYCTGNYPPTKAWDTLLKRRRDFAQLEDFNTHSRK